MSNFKMVAIIKNGSQKIKVNVKNRIIDGSCYVRIVDEFGVVYETHLSNVLFIDDGGKE